MTYMIASHTDATILVVLLYIQFNNSIHDDIVGTAVPLLQCNLYLIQ